MKKAVASILALTMLAGCSGQPATQPGSDSQPSAAVSGSESQSDAVKTGLSVSVSVASSKAADAATAGLAQADITLVAVTVGDDGVIQDCVIDMVQSKVNFDATGKLSTDLSTTFASKNELGDNYGMKKGSSIGKEWYEQAAALADYAVGKTVGELKGISLSEGKATDADLAASVTMSIGGFLSAIEDAVSNATHMGARAGDRLALSSSTNIAKSKSAEGENAGLAQAYATIAAVTFDGDKITSCYIDGLQANVNFDATGAITTDLTAAQQSKNQLGDAYGMKKGSAIGKEWDEQAAAFGQYVVGKTAAEVNEIAVSEGKPVDADLSASVTIGIGEFQTLIGKAAQ